MQVQPLGELVTNDTDPRTSCNVISSLTEQLQGWHHRPQFETHYISKIAFFKSCFSFLNRPDLKADFPQTQLGRITMSEHLLNIITSRVGTLGVARAGPVFQVMACFVGS